jgi:hypothetical protein
MRRRRQADGRGCQTRRDWLLLIFSCILLGLLLLLLQLLLLLMCLCLRRILLGRSRWLLRDQLHAFGLYMVLVVR